MYSNGGIYIPDRKPPMGVFRNPYLKINRGLVLDTMMWEGAGPTVEDLSGNGNIGIFGAGIASPIWVAGKYGSALDFDGGDRIDCGNIIYPNNEMTVICAGTRDVDDADVESIFSQGEYYEVDSAFVMRVYTADRIGFSVHQNYIYKDDTNLAMEWPLNETVVWAISYKKGSWGKVYRNGIFWGNLNDYSDSIPTTYNVRIGNDRNENEGWKGKVEYACIYNRALYPFEIAQLAQEPFCGFRWPSIEQLAVYYEEVVAAGGIVSPHCRVILPHSPF